MLRPCCSQSHLPTACHWRRMPVMGTQMARSQSCTRSHSDSWSASCSVLPHHPDTPAPGFMPPGILRPSSHSAFTPVGHQSPSPSPFYSFKGFHMEEEAFLHDLCDELGTLGDLYSVAASLGFSHSRVDQFMMSFPNNFPKVVFTTLAAWYTTSGDSFYAKLDALEKAFKDTHKGALFSHISHCHTEAFKYVCSLPQIHLPDADAMDESLGRW